MKCPNCDIENPKVYFCGDAYNGTWSLNDFQEWDIDDGWAYCKSCDKIISMRFKLIQIIGQDSEFKEKSEDE